MKRKESNKFSTKINFLSWLIEVKVFKAKDLTKLYFRLCPSYPCSSFPSCLFMCARCTGGAARAQPQLFVSLTNSNVIPRWCSTICPPVFYILSAEREKLKRFRICCFLAPAPTSVGPGQFEVLDINRLAATNRINPANPNMQLNTLNLIPIEVVESTSM